MLSREIGAPVDTIDSDYLRGRNESALTPRFALQTLVRGTRRDGRPVAVRMTKNEIEKMFKRIV